MQPGGKKHVQFLKTFWGVYHGKLSVRKQTALVNGLHHRHRKRPIGKRTIC